jgi:hypothetical protein
VYPPHEIDLAGRDGNGKNSICIVAEDAAKSKREYRAQVVKKSARVYNGETK